MPSPFPGMDPYLEGELWQEFHERLANEISAQLMPKLGAKYVALLAKRYVLDSPTLALFDLPPRTFYPDAHVVERDPGGAAPAPTTLIPTPPTIEAFNLAPVPQLSVEIRDVAQRRLVTLIEVLSPANKTGDGIREYNERRADLLRTRTHMLEIDLLRGGTHIALGSPLPPAPYYVYLTRAETRHAAKVWAIQLPDRLPVMPVPLLQPDPDVMLDQQAAVDACFALVGYERLIDYSAALPPPEISRAERAWVAKRVAQ